MSENIGENCGIILAHSLPEAYSGAGHLQHRGQEAAGIAAMNGNEIRIVKWRGKVTDFSLDSLQMFLPASKFHMYAAHVRYATKGRKEKILHDAHPHVIGGRRFERFEHVYIDGAESAIVHNGQIDAQLAHEFIDPANLRTDCDSEALLHACKKLGIEQTMQLIPRTYAAILFDSNSREAIAFRDRYGRMPCWIGEDSTGRRVIASEDGAMRKNGWTPIRELTPGEAVYISTITGSMASKQILSAQPLPCIFQRTYHMSPDSTHNGVLVSAERERLGRALAEEFPREADVVTYVPRCPKHAAIGYAKTTGQESKFLDVFYKKKTTRVFMESTQGKRENEMEEMHMFPHVDVEGKDVVVIDDSIIRGTEAERAVRLLREAGARKIYFMSYTPPIGKEINGIKYGCVDGVDIPPEPPEEWNYAVRKWGSVEGVRNHLRVNELCYLSIDGMLKALNETATTTCTTCMSGWPKPSTYEHNLVQVTPSSYARR